MLKLYANNKTVNSNESSDFSSELREKLLQGTEGSKFKEKKCNKSST